MSEAVPLAINELNSPFWEGAAQGRLMLPFCLVHQQAFWPPSPVSPLPGGRAVAWREADPDGVLTSRAVYRRCFQAPFEVLMPYAVGLVALDCGPRLLAFLPNPDDPDSPRPGARVRIGFSQLIAGNPPAPTVVRSTKGVDFADSVDRN